MRRTYSGLLIVLKVLIILASQIDDALLKYSRLRRRVVVLQGAFIYSAIHSRSGSYTLAAFSGIDLPDNIKSPVIRLKSMWGVLKVPSTSKFLISAISGKLTELHQIIPIKLLQNWHILLINKLSFVKNYRFLSKKYCFTSR